MDNYIFSLDPRVERTNVKYKNRFGITIDADLYLSKAERPAGNNLPGVVIGPPYGGTKEQAPGIYAQELAKAGFAALAYDPSFYGYSGGEPRFEASPDVYVEDFMAGVDFLGTQDKLVNREQIGALGICGSGGFALSAAQVDPRIKAVVTASMYDISRYIREGLHGSLSETERKSLQATIAKQRWEDFKTGEPTLDSRDTQLEALTGQNNDPVAKEFAQFYLTPTGYHHNAISQHTLASQLSFMNFSLLDHLADISPRPVLLVAGEKAHSRYFSEDAYKELQDPKELYIVPGANHTDLYYKTSVIPFQKIISFLKTNLTKN